MSHTPDLSPRALSNFGLAAIVAAIAAATATDFATHRTVFFAGAAGAGAMPLLAAVAPTRLRWIRRPAGFASIPLLTLMEAYSGGVASSYAVLLMMAMIWFGLVAEERDIVAMAPLLAACCFLPMLVIGGPAFPVHWGHATLLLFVGLAVTAALRGSARDAGRAAERARRNAVVDPMSGLLNRRGWELVCRPSLERAHRAERPLAMLLVEIDAAEVSSGGGIDDLMRRRLAEEMRSTLRGGDVLARLGENRFAAILTDTGADGALTAVHRLRSAAGGQLACSCGVAVLVAGERLEDLTARAHEALATERCEQAPQIAFTPEPAAGEPPSGRLARKAHAA
jgi:diguanylate cyclase (GGDEF)-like protein